MATFEAHKSRTLESNIQDQFSPFYSTELRQTVFATNTHALLDIVSYLNVSCWCWCCCWRQACCFAWRLLQFLPSKTNRHIFNHADEQKMRAATWVSRHRTTTTYSQLAAYATTSKTEQAYTSSSVELNGCHRQCKLLVCFLSVDTV